MLFGLPHWEYKQEALGVIRYVGGFAWARILSRRPEFAYRCDWSKLKPLAWLQLLVRQPQFTDKCDKWDGMRPFGGDRQWDVCGKFVEPL